MAMEGEPSVSRYGMMILRVSGRGEAFFNSPSTACYYAEIARQLSLAVPEKDGKGN